MRFIAGIPNLAAPLGALRGNSLRPSAIIRRRVCSGSTCSAAVRLPFQILQLPDDRFRNVPTRNATAACSFADEKKIWHSF